MNLEVLSILFSVAAYSETMHDLHTKTTYFLFEIFFLIFMLF